VTVSHLPLREGPTLVDFESRSRADLKAKGGRLYWEDPSSEVICSVLYHVETGEVTTWAPGEPAPNLALAVAHNATTFDRHAAGASGWQVGQWLDSSHAARRAGLPGALDALAKRWLGRPKDAAGSKLTKSLSRVSRAKKTYGQLPEITEPVRQRVLAYCADDVEVMADAWSRLEPWLDVDADVAEVDTIVNDRGIYLDQNLVRALQTQLERQESEALASAADAMGWSVADVKAAAMSPQKFAAATGLPNAQAGTIEDALTGKLQRLDAVAHNLCLARQAIASVVPGKLAACLERVSSDGFVRDAHHYFGAHTGRWSSKGIQLHNLPRVGFEDPAKKLGWDVGDYIEALVEGAMTGQILTQDEISGLLRAVFCPPPGEIFAVLDYSGIEARANAWAANDAKALDVFRALDAGTGPDPYRVMAATIFGAKIGDVSKLQRSVGKAAELGCGYGMGPSKFEATCLKAGVDLAALGVDAADVVQAWRKLHAPIVQLWKACERAFAVACEGRRGTAGPWVYEAHGEDVWCVLPSGRPIVYANAKASRDPRGGYELSYQGHLFTEHVYGGLLVENAVQATCRDLLALALVNCERAGLTPRLHVHDELVCSVPSAIGREGLEEQRRIMSDVPEWADGLPIKLDGFLARRYRK
jgi:DNA polymerase